MCNHFNFKYYLKCCLLEYYLIFSYAERSKITVIFKKI